MNESNHHTATKLFGKIDGLDDGRCQARAHKLEAEAKQTPEVQRETAKRRAIADTF